MALTRPNALPLLPLADDSILLPGIVIRIPIANRPDIPSLLSHVYSHASKFGQRFAKSSAAAMLVGCVPLSSPLLSQDGQKLIAASKGEGDESQERSIAEDGAPAKRYLFGFGTLAKIAGVEGKGTGELALLVEGLSRIRIEKITQVEPYYVAEVVHHDDGGLFLTFKTLRLMLKYLD